MKTKTYTALELLLEANTLSSSGFADEFYGDAALLDGLDTLSEDLYGTVVLKEDTTGNYTIIDGLQRIVTYSLLLYALCECYKKTSSKNEIARSKIFLRYLTKKGANPVKLKLLFDEERVYEKIILSEKLSEEEKKNPLFQILHHFWSEIKNDEISASQLFKKLSKVKFFVISTDEKSMDSRDLYILFNREKANPLYLITDFIKENCPEDYVFWENMIGEYTKLELEDFLNNFLHDYILGRLNCLNMQFHEIYSKFKQFYKQVLKYQSPNEIIKNLNLYASYYLKILQADFSDISVQNRFIEIKENGGDDTFPYLMEVLEDYESGNITREIFLDILDMINKFVINRPANSEINFATLGKELNQMLLK